MSIEVRKWGFFKTFVTNSQCTVKLLILKKGKSTSLQYHNERGEFWYVLSGEIKTIIDKKMGHLIKGKHVHVRKKSIHRIEAIVDSEILEISFGRFDEEDIVRIK